MSTSPGGERKRTEMVQLGVIRPAICILDEVDSGLDVDVWAKWRAACNMPRPSGAWGCWPSRTSSRFLVQLEADLVHVLIDGRIVATGDAALALQLEQTGYAGYEEKR